jgi:YidC/Oxa1 family membrane protein insertase
MQLKDSGGLDKRTLIAFALMALVWVVFIQFMPKQSAPPSEPAPEGVVAGAETARAANPGEPAPERAGGGGSYPGEALPAAAGDAEQRERSGAEMSAGYRGAHGKFENRLEAQEQAVTVKGDRYEAAFAARGGTLQHWVLNEYTDTKGQRIDLVQEYPGALGLYLMTPSGEIDLNEALFSVEERSLSSGSGVREIRFVAEAAEDFIYPDLRVERVYRVDPARFDMQMDLFVTGVSNFRRDHQLAIAWDRGIPSVDHKLAHYGETKEAVALLAENLVKNGFGGSSFGCGCGGGSKGDSKESFDGIVRWVGVKGKYFAGFLVPSDPIEGTVQTHTVDARTEAGMRLLIPLEYEGATNLSFRVYAGPLDHEIIGQLDKELGADLGRIENMGPSILRPVAVAIRWFLVQGHKVIPNYGIVILLLALLVRVIFHPLNVRALRSQQKMQALKPKLDEINKKYKDDPQLRTKRTMELHKSEGINPIGGCLPLLPQMPVFFALYGVMMNAIELRHSSFVWWIQDLSSPDKVGEIAGIPIHILPLFMGAAQYLQQKSMPTDPKQAPMMMMMPLIMVFFLYSLPSGLVLYWTATSLVTWAQQKMTKPPAPKPAAAESESTQTGKTKPKKRGKRF